MPSSPQRAFVAAVDAPITIAGRTYVFGPRPNLLPKRVLYSAKGKRGEVYWLIEQGTGRHYAFKRFLPRYQDKDQAEVATALARFAQLPGMKAAERTVITPDTDPVLFNQYRELRFAVLMPWLGGGSLETWSDVLVRMKEGDRILTPPEAKRLATRFLTLMSALESMGAAHTDIASGNVVCDPGTGDVELIDLEDFYVAGRPELPLKNTGADGYRHRATPEEGIWSPEADRFAAAVLAAEMLGSCNASLMALVKDDHLFFDPPREDEEDGQAFSRPSSELHDPQSRTYLALIDHLRTHWPDFAVVFARSWTSPMLDVAPTLTELAAALGPVEREVYVIREFASSGLELTSDRLVRGSELSIETRLIEGTEVAEHPAPGARLALAMHFVAWLPFMFLCFGPTGPTNASRVVLIMAGTLLLGATLVLSRRRLYECRIQVRGLDREIVLAGGLDPQRIARLVASVRLLSEIARGLVRRA